MVSAKEVRLFGKILCRNNDYWIAEVKGGLLEGDNNINIEKPLDPPTPYI
jgi:hypothetical protein